MRYEVANQKTAASFIASSSAALSPIQAETPFLTVQTAGTPPHPGGLRKTSVRLASDVLFRPFVNLFIQPTHQERDGRELLCEPAYKRSS